MTRALPRPGLAALATLLLLLALPACSFAPPPRYYLLNPVALEAPARPPAGRARILAIDPVVLPEYLDRPEIVARTAGQELAVSDASRWGERLQAGLDRILALDLSAQLSRDGIVVASGSQTPDIDYELAVVVDAFEKDPQGNAMLAARWTVLDGRRRTVLARSQGIYTEPVAGPGDDAQVIALNRTLDRLSTDLAASIRSTARSVAR